ncbi:glycoside hydrolase family 53 protein [Winogradskyella aquimaris]|uniref:Arabinogalactan endo-beta-1,4-galactanase n=1 Tax=Winogradskyella aquimaris TaxID=864074 RepID=A0ABU5ELQ3_9FLAO|nr:glycosyl hydrolase 53 family protein [Winogradskyella aquimaris]MDY2587365.1 glycosyl hydrolase 53 family protein [Winogradskyella aquimaris]
MKKSKLTVNYFTTIFLLSCLLGVNSCSKNNSDTNDLPSEDTSISFYYGADLSYVNEMEDCGAIYKDSEGTVTDVYQIFRDEGANLVRVRLWHNPDWTNYSNYNDVKETIQRAKSKGLKVLLDFHYSDTWADPSKQEIPAAWVNEINNTPVLRQLVYDYTYTTLEQLSNDNLLPDIVQVGNEINGMILQQGELVWPIDWERNSALINKGIEAVRAISTAKNKTIEIMLHIAQPENGLWWFEQATSNGVTDFDWIGLSYYPIWSDYDLNEVQTPLSTLINTYNKKLMIVETAYPFTLDNADSANNILGADALTGGFPATQQGQLDYLNQLKQIIENAGGQGLVYWEPAWVSTGCSTLWAQGSHWDNATLFDQTGKATLGMQFYNNSLND